MEYTFGHYGIVCNPDYRYERDFSESKYNCDITYGYEGGYFINFFDEISGGHITYNKAVITDEEGKETVKEEKFAFRKLLFCISAPFLTAADNVLSVPTR